jgi:hypothetical protein
VNGVRSLNLTNDMILGDIVDYHHKVGDLHVRRDVLKILSFRTGGCDKNSPIMLRLARGTWWVSSHHGQGDRVQPEPSRPVRTIIS